MLKKFLLLILTTISLSAGAQTIVDLQFKQNPLFSVSTNKVNAALSDFNSLTLGADLTISGGSGSYTYLWTDTDGEKLGAESTLEVSTPGTYLLTVSDLCDCKQIVEFNIESAGIEAMEIPDVELKLIGNILLINGSEAKQVTLFSTNGAMTYLSVPATPASQFSLASLEPGIYVIQVVLANGKLITSKISIS